MNLFNKRGLLIAGVIISVAYLLTYIALRQTHVEVWETDNKEYVIFPEDKAYLYYFYRPLTYVDASLTGMKFHIGAHR